VFLAYIFIYSDRNDFIFLRNFKNLSVCDRKKPRTLTSGKADVKMNGNYEKFGFFFSMLLRFLSTNSIVFCNNLLT